MKSSLAAASAPRGAPQFHNEGRSAYERVKARSWRTRWKLVAAALSLNFALGFGAYALAGATSPQSTASSAPRSSHPAAPGALAPNGTYTTPSGATNTIAALRGRPTMVWFVAWGCASCAASIPVVAANLGELTHMGFRVLSLGLFGYFPPGRKGVAELLSFGRAAARSNIARPGWSWGLASKALSIGYDPEAVPDLYVLIDSSGHIRYRNAGPVSTMPQLIEAAARVTRQRLPATHVRSTPSVPCC